MAEAERVVLHSEKHQKRKELTSMNPEMQSFFETKKVNGRNVLVAVVPMTMEQARQAYPYRPYSRYAESKFGGNTHYDDFAVLLNGFKVLFLEAKSALPFLGWRLFFYKL